MTSSPLLADLYLRLSDGRHENGSFVERQKSLEDRASGLGWRVNRVIIENDLIKGGSKSASAFKRKKVTLPNGEVAYRVNRPGFRTVIDDLAKGRVQAVLAEDLDRTVRDPRDLEDLIDVVERVNGWADSLSGSLRFTNGGTDSEITMARMMVSVANKESRDKARRSAASRERKAGRGVWGGGRRPYGFTPIPSPEGGHQNTTLVLNMVEVEEIRSAADQVLSGIALKSIARDMNGRKVATVTGAKWSAETLRDILMRSLNAGIVTYAGAETDVRLPGEAILSEEVWRAVVGKLTDPQAVVVTKDKNGHTRTYLRGQGVGRAPVWLGTGIYRCVCGSVMEIQRGKNRAASYKCARVGGTGDVHVRRNAEALDRYVSAAVCARLMLPDAVDLVAKPKAEVDVPALRREVEALRERGKQLAQAFADGDIDRVALRAGNERIKVRTTAAEAALAEAVETSPLAPLVSVENVAETWLSLSLGQRRAVVAELLTVTVLPAARRPGFAEDAVQLDWRVGE